jgi:hypothetical protein
MDAGGPRYFLIDPNLRLGTNGGATLPYRQDVRGSVSPVQSACHSAVQHRAGSGQRSEQRRFRQHLVMDRRFRRAADQRGVFNSQKKVMI